jgi:EF-hand domain pair/EF hand
METDMLKRNAILIPVMLIAAPAAAAQGSDGALLDRMLAADTNKDGVITRPELIASRTGNFARFDRNGDGVLTDSDVPFFLRGSAIGQQFTTMKADFDANRDGKVSRDEFVNGPTPVFDRADADRDNRLTRAEIDAAKTQAGR